MAKIYKVWVKVHVEEISDSEEYLDIWESEPIDVFCNSKKNIVLTAAQTLVNFCESFATMPLKQLVAFPREKK